MSILLRNEILIPAITPYLLERGALWFSKNFSKIKKAYEAGKGFWKDNILILEKDKKYQLSELLRNLDEMGYEKVQNLTSPGEFSLRGGILNIFPICSKIAFIIDFLGNQIEDIRGYKFKFNKEEVKKELIKRLDKETLINLKPGDYLVHLDHGITRFSGIGKSQIPSTKSQTISNIQSPKSQTEYYILEYAGGDKLYVPVGLEKKLSRYIGFIEPKISRLGSPLWVKTKKKVKEDIIKTAKELLALYAKRETSSRPPYLQDDEIQRELESSFSYQETPDQIKAIREIKNDLTLKNRPMDRIICGDVGFGKTEVAIRTAFKVVLSARQVAMIAPTTILADQHFHTFKDRLKNFPVEIILLSRLQTKSEQKEILRKINNGRADIVIGTHRLLSKDVQFKNLGLVIVDEEQKFGVRQKEKFKEMRANVDILSLSATPIPRTLYLGLTKLREISLIQTPPPERLPIKIFILPWSQNLIKEVCQKEIARNGEIYYLHNRIETIELVKKQIQEILPRAKIGIAHGRMREKKVLKIMHDLRHGKIDMLIATTIIENGLDLPNVNTLIVADATRLGLSQAYQIKGRIGRGHIQAYAYFLYPPKFLGWSRGLQNREAAQKFGRANPTPKYEKARQRFLALKEAEELGSGYQIAQKDLEIRGAGNILGKEQSGSINKVGLNLYCQMLNEAVEEMKKTNQRVIK